MERATIHRVLADAAEDFSLFVFSNPDAADLATEALDATGRWHQRECPLKAPLVFWFVVMMGVFRDKSLSHILLRLFDMVEARGVDLPPRPVTTEAICHARERLGIEPLEYAFRSTASQVDPEPSFHGLRPWAVDGSRAEVPDTPANEAFFGRPKASRGHAAFPQVQMVPLVDVRSHRIRAVTLRGCRESERTALQDFLPLLGRKDVILHDRGYPAAWLLADFQKAGVHFVMRLSTTWKLRRIESLGVGDEIVEIRGPVPLPPEEQTPHRKNRIERFRLRLVTYCVGGSEEIRILTDLLDPQVYPARDLAELYHARWEVELSFDSIKNHLAPVPQGALRTVFRSRSPQGVLQEAWGMLLAYNLIRQMMTEAAGVHQLDPLTLSFTGAVECVRTAMPRFDAASPTEYPELMARLLDRMAAYRISRPRRPVSNPRVVKRKMSNFRVKKPGQVGRKRDYERELTLGRRRGRRRATG